MFLYFGFVLLAFLVGQSTSTEQEQPKADYSVLVKNIILSEDAKSYFEEGPKGMKMTKMNKTHAKINGDCRLKKSLPLDAFIEILGYERDKNNHNAYLDKDTINITRPVCEFMGNDKMIYPPLLLASNFPHTCPVEAGNYDVKDYYMDMSNFPPNPPSDHWKFIIKMYEYASCSAPVMANCEMYIELERKKKKEKGGEKKKGDKKEDNKEEGKEEKKEKKEDKKGPGAGAYNNKNAGAGASRKGQGKKGG